MPPGGRPGPGECTGDTLCGVALPLSSSNATPKYAPPHRQKHIASQTYPPTHSRSQTQFPPSLASNSYPLPGFTQPGPKRSPPPLPTHRVHPPHTPAGQLTRGQNSESWGLPSSIPFLTLWNLPQQIWDHLPPHSPPPPRPANFLGCPQVPFHCPPGLRLGPAARMRNPNFWPRLKWGHAGPRPGTRTMAHWGKAASSPFLPTPPPPSPSPSPLGPCPRTHQWQQQARHGGEAHDRPAVASYSPIRAQAVVAAAAAAAESGV